MARIKQTIMQRSFAFMEVREDVLEGDDLELRQTSLQKARNMRSLATRAIEARPGTFFEKNATGATDTIEINPTSDLKFGLIIGDDYLQIIDENGFVVENISPVPWTSEDTIWVEPFREETIVGGTFGMYRLLYEDGVWYSDEFVFEASTGGDIAQPYWSFEKNVAIRPSGKVGNIVVDASAPVWDERYVGSRIRYGFREIEVTEYISPTQIRGRVINALPPSYNIGVANPSQFRIGDAVIGEDTNYQGIVTDIVGSNLIVVTLQLFEGPDTSENLTSSDGSSAIGGFVEVVPQPSPVWDEPLISVRRGYPRSASTASGRLLLLDFPEAPGVIAASSSRDPKDFKVGANDDDAIVREYGDNSPRWLHAVNMGDVVLLADNGIYYIPTRDNGVLSPSTFNVVFVDEVGASTIRPVKVEDGVVFIDASRQRVSAALLDGNVYLKWSVRTMTTFHDHQIKNPVKLCGPSLGEGITEKYLFVVNGDGTLASVSWQESIREEQVGFAPWDTQGSFVSVSPMFGGYWALVDREITGGTQRMLERFSTDAYVDSAVVTSGPDGFEYLEVTGGELTMDGDPLVWNGDPLVFGGGTILDVNGEGLEVLTPGAQHLPGTTATIYSNGWDAGDFEVDTDGSLIGDPGFEGERQVGLNFVSEIKLWPVELIESPRIGSLTARVMQAIISVQRTHGFDAILNRTTRKVGAYQMGDDLSVPPPERTKVYKFAVFGRRDHPEITFRKSRPGRFRVLATGQKVQG